MRTTTLRQLIDTPGPFHLDDSHDAEDAGKQLEPKLRGLADELSAQRARQAAVAAIEDAVRAGPRPVGHGGRAVVAGPDTAPTSRLKHGDGKRIEASWSAGCIRT